jgi:hypothetical protein
MQENEREKSLFDKQESSGKLKMRFFSGTKHRVREEEDESNIEIRKIIIRRR